MKKQINRKKQSKWRIWVATFSILSLSYCIAVPLLIFYQCNIWSKSYVDINGSQPISGEINTKINNVGTFYAKDLDSKKTLTAKVINDNNQPLNIDVTLEPINSTTEKYSISLLAKEVYDKTQGKITIYFDTEVLCQSKTLIMTFVAPPGPSAQITSITHELFQAAYYVELCTFIPSLIDNPLDIVPELSGVEDDYLYLEIRLKSENLYQVLYQTKFPSTDKFDATFKLTYAGNIIANDVNVWTNNPIGMSFSKPKITTFVCRVEIDSWIDVTYSDKFNSFNIAYWSVEIYLSSSRQILNQFSSYSGRQGEEFPSTLPMVYFADHGLSEDVYFTVTLISESWTTDGTLDYYESESFHITVTTP